jgi:hypothetical protein
VSLPDPPLIVTLLRTTIILTNPETPHTMDILQKLDLVDFSNTYIVCDCANVIIVKDNNEFKNSLFRFDRWYQHKTVNRKLHFCSVISKENFIKCGGFDEQYCMGMCAEDKNFVKRVEQAGIVIETREDLIVNHINHYRGYHINREEIDRLIGINAKIWEFQLKENRF